jgi:hypothetical protein
MLHRILRIALIILDAFLALTAFAGGIGLLTGAAAPSTDLLKGSPFTSYVIPGLSLVVIVGGCALAAAILLLRRHPQAALVALASGVIIIGFEIVEVLVIGSDPGLARSLQIFYFTLGLLIAVIAAVMLLIERRATPQT